MMKIGNVDIKNRIVLAPMAGYTNPAFRRIAKEFGAGLVFSEMISANGLLYDNDKTWELAKTYPEERPVALQVFGGEAETLAQAARLLERKAEFDILDINMGCPVRKVLKANAGCALLKDPKKAAEIVSAVASAVSKPVSVKIRAGFDHKHINCVEIARAVEKAGASMITIHGRTQTDLYRGKVNLDYIRAVKEAVRIPVIGNGDIKSVEDAALMAEVTGVDYLMVGRGALGNPWLIRDMVDYFSGLPLKEPPGFKEKIELCLRHFSLLLEEKPEPVAVMEMRSWTAWYLKGLANIRHARKRLMTVKTKDELIGLLTEIIDIS
ncbi:MAG: tRNA dihydrouridine synthase DusB [Bacilli bacterium]|nr:tRNA dihydrouridine synthase DusB [Acholeplasmataceae bacterium]